jgi:hypothetical protein
MMPETSSGVRFAHSKAVIRDDRTVPWSHYDELYQIFLEDKVKLIFDGLRTRVAAKREAVAGDLKQAHAAS